MPEKILREREVLELVPVSTETLRRWERAGTFPKRFKLNPQVPQGQWAGAVGWRESDVLAWLDARTKAAS